VPTKVFNVGSYRRRLADQVTHTFFRHDNQQANELRMQAAMEALNDMIAWLLVSEHTEPAQNGTITTDIGAYPEDHISAKVAIYDATNSTHDRRRILYEHCTARDIQVMFIESICTDESVILRNIREVKLTSPDYLNTDPDQATNDFQERIRHYEEAYQPVGGDANVELTDEQRWSFVKLINVGSQVIINLIHGYLQSRVVYYLMNLHPSHRSIFMSRHGESMFNLAGRIGGDADLSPRGQLFAKVIEK
jgi:6-phosphofructo-2-kinase/fructose-2,6-biphosphatase 2